MVDEILSIDDVTRTTITNCLSWSETLNKQCADDFALIRDLIAKKKACCKTIEGLDHKVQNKLSNEIYDL